MSDPIKRRAFLTALSAAAAPQILAASKTALPPVIVGHGSHRYRVEKDWSRADHRKFPLNDCHEMVQASDGRLFLLTNQPQNNVLIYQKDGTLLSHWTLKLPGAHGLTLQREDVRDVLYITDISGRVIKTTLEGEILLELPHPQKTGAYAPSLPYSPTETAIAPNGEILVIDGYGSQFVLRYSSDGRFIDKFGGKSMIPTNLGKFAQAHGIALDTRGPEPLLVCTARIRNELVWFSLDGTHRFTHYYPGAYLSRPVIHGKNLYSAVCFGFKPDDFRMWKDRGFVMILDENHKVISCPGACPPRYEGDRLLPLMKEGDLVKNAHDVCVDDQQDLYICQWSSGHVPPIKLHRLDG